MTAIFVAYCEACAAMGMPEKVEVVVIGDRCELMVPDRCAWVHPALAPPDWRYRVIRSDDDGGTWKLAWRIPVYKDDRGMV